MWLLQNKNKKTAKKQIEKDTKNKITTKGWMYITETTSPFLAKLFDISCLSFFTVLVSKCHPGITKKRHRG